MAVSPGVDGDGVHFIAMVNTGYHAAVASNGKTQFNNAKVDELAISVGNGERWVEQAKRESTVVSTLADRKSILADTRARALRRRRRGSPGEQVRAGCPSMAGCWRISGKITAERAYGSTRWGSQQVELEIPTNP